MGTRNIIHAGRVETYDGRPRPSLFAAFLTDGRGRSSYELSRFSPKEVSRPREVHSGSRNTSRIATGLCTALRQLPDLLGTLSIKADYLGQPQVEHLDLFAHVLDVHKRKADADDFEWIPRAMRDVLHSDDIFRCQGSVAVIPKMRQKLSRRGQHGDELTQFQILTRDALGERWLHQGLRGRGHGDLTSGLRDPDMIGEKEIQRRVVRVPVRFRKPTGRVSNPQYHGLQRSSQIIQPDPANATRFAAKPSFVCCSQRSNCYPTNNNAESKRGGLCPLFFWNF